MFLLFCVCSFSFYGLSDHLHLRSFPTRRSSDLMPSWSSTTMPSAVRHTSLSSPLAPRRRAGSRRSEEQTSELQSLTNLVCHLLLEKKKKSKVKIKLNHEQKNNIYKTSKHS